MRVVRPGGVYLVLPGAGGGSTCGGKAGVTQLNFGYTSSSGHDNLDRLKAYFEAGKVRPHIFSAVPLERAAAAFALDKAGQVVGKVAVVPSAL